MVIKKNTDKNKAAPTRKVYLTHNIFIKTTSPLFEVVDDYAFLCKNLKNSSLYVFRQAFFNENRTLNQYELINLFTEMKQADYCAIPRKVAQKVIFQVAQEFQSFWGLMKLYSQSKVKSAGAKGAAKAQHSPNTVAKMSKPKLPRYLHKEKGRANVIFTNQAVSKKDLANGILTLSPFDKSRPISLKLGKLSKIITAENLKEVRIVKAQNGYDVKIIYAATDVGTAHKQKGKSSDNNSHAVNKILRALSIDFGINNLMTVANNTEMTPIIFSGKPLKSFNQHFNKELAKLHEQLDKTKNSFVKTRIQKEINKLYQKRKHKVNDFLHKASRQLINHAVCNNIDTIVVGYNQGWKQEIKMGSVNNQKFAFIPFLTLLNMIKYKAELAGINVIVTEESYTSKCSFLDYEELKRHDVYKGKRIHRGLFKSANGMMINADVNGAFNILRKVIGDFEYNPIRACSRPKKFNVLKQKIMVNC